MLFSYSHYGTDGHRTIGRTWHASRWKNSALTEAVCLSTRNTLPLPHPVMIRFWNWPRKKYSLKLEINEIHPLSWSQCRKGRPYYIRNKSQENFCPFAF